MPSSRQRPGETRAAAAANAGSEAAEGAPELPAVLENLPSKCFTRHKKLHLPGSFNGRHWLFVREGLHDSRKDCPPHQGPKDAFLPHIHHGAPNATPKKKQNGLTKGAALLSKLSQTGKAFSEDVESNLTVHPLALYPHLEEALPAELLLQVLEVLDPERKLEHTWAYCQGAKKLRKEPTKLVEKCASQPCRPKKIPLSRAGQWLYEEKPSEVDPPCKDSPLHDNARRGVSDFCDWATALGSSTIDEEFVLQQFDLDYQTRRSCDELHAMRLNQNPHKPKWVKMRYGAWYLNTNLWKKQRADEPLVDPKISHRAQDENLKKQLQEEAKLLASLHGTAAFKDFLLSRGYRMPRFLEKIYAEEKGKSENIKAPKKLTQTERNPGRR